MIGDYSPIIAIVASIIIAFIVYYFILRPLVNHIVLINMSGQAQTSKRIIIRDRKYNIEEFKAMREKLLMRESRELEDKLYNKVNNFINGLIKTFNVIKTYINKIFNRIKLGSKNKKVNKKDFEKGDIYEDIQNEEKER